MFSYLFSSRSSFWASAASMVTGVQELSFSLLSKGSSTVSPYHLATPSVIAIGAAITNNSLSNEEKLHLLCGAVKGSIGTLACAYLFATTGFPASLALLYGSGISMVINLGMAILQHSEEQRLQNYRLAHRNL